MKSVLKGLFFYETGSCTGPLIDIYETDDDLVFEIDLPGIDPQDVSIRIYEDLVILEGVIKRASDEKTPVELKYLCMERSLKGFRRVLKIPVPVNTMAGEAFYANGVVKLSFPKLKGKLIRIKIERR